VAAASTSTNTSGAVAEWSSSLNSATSSSIGGINSPAGTTSPSSDRSESSKKRGSLLQQTRSASSSSSSSSTASAAMHVAMEDWCGFPKCYDTRNEWLILNYMVRYSCVLSFLTRVCNETFVSILISFSVYFLDNEFC
jgi:hypothetical protein